MVVSIVSLLGTLVRSFVSFFPTGFSRPLPFGCGALPAACPPFPPGSPAPGPAPLSPGRACGLGPGPAPGFGLPVVTPPSTTTPNSPDCPVRPETAPTVHTTGGVAAAPQFPRWGRGLRCPGRGSPRLPPFGLLAFGPPRLARLVAGGCLRRVTHGSGCASRGGGGVGWRDLGWGGGAPHPVAGWGETGGDETRNNARRIRLRLDGRPRFWVSAAEARGSAAAAGHRDRRTVFARPLSGKTTRTPNNTTKNTPPRPLPPSRRASIIWGSTSWGPSSWTSTRPPDEAGWPWIGGLFRFGRERDAAGAEPATHGILSVRRPVCSQVDTVRPGMPGSPKRC